MPQPVPEPLQHFEDEEETAGPGRRHVVYTNLETHERMRRFKERTGVPMRELVIMSCRNEIIAGGTILNDDLAEFRARRR